LRVGSERPEKKEHYPIEKPTVAELIELSLEEKGMSQKQLAGEIISLENGAPHATGKPAPSSNTIFFLFFIFVFWIRSFKSE